MPKECTIFWFRRDLRLEDNVGLYHALESDFSVLPIFIFDPKILEELPQDDPRVGFIYSRLEKMQTTLNAYDTSIEVKHSEPLTAFKELSKDFKIKHIVTNRDYEPYARQRDSEIKTWAEENDITFTTYKDQVIFEIDEVVKQDGLPYTVYTPYKNKWLETFNASPEKPVSKLDLNNFLKHRAALPSLGNLGFKESEIKVPEIDLSVVSDYAKTRDYPAQEGTSHIGPHLRFGTVGIRSIVAKVKDKEGTYLSELIWREFFMQILYHYPKVISNNFRAKYDGIQWRNNKEDFKKWCHGETGYPMVDAGMRELNQTGYMHNRVRMVVASFLCKHLLIDWQWGEAYFATKLLDYELAANNGNWQWAAGTGCDAAPYFRIFNPTSQLEKFDKHKKYIHKWIPEYGTDQYPSPMVDHKEARERALAAYKKGIEN
ncbi:MAG: deoxyribodipyrimidine photo-lyase [Gilvibacter sp.]